MIISSNVSDLSVQRVSVAFVNDNDLVTDREDAEEKMGRIVTTYNDLHSAMGGYIEENKSKYFSYQWKIRSGYKVIKNINREVEINHLKLQ